MKEIKFRAWGKNIKEFLSPDGKTFGLTLKEIQNIEDINIWEFQQFTGLKDKNGKDIYEGDVVREEFNHGIKNCEIIYELGGYFIKNEKEEIKDNLHWHIKGTEVIGNIFENPELINHPLT